MDEAYHKKQGGKQTHPRCDAIEINISDQRIRGEKNEKKERIGKVIAVHTVRKSREALLCGDRREVERGRGERGER